MSAGPGFNLSTRKDDLSTRLKTQNLKRAKEETRKLEWEGRKMEERLTELKMAMNREKEERERQGGGFWKSGQQGTLNNYAEEVLTKKKSKSAQSKGKIKILRDKPLDLPERNNQPGTMAYIAQRGSHTPRDKPKGPKCGQCEERTAAVSCVQCSEDYCPGCFAAFHLKGNLKKHRSVPLMATPRQCFASPRPSQTSVSYDFQAEGDGAVELQVPDSARKKDRNSPEGASGTYENSLLNGTYNEAEQAASFQNALQAWRTGKSTDNSSSGGGSRPSTDRSTKKQGVPYSPVQTPTVNVNSSTGTEDSKQEVEIKFTENMTYAERLLLKKHRRTDVDALFTPREGDVSARPTPRGDLSSRPTPRSSRSSRNLHREVSGISLKIEDFNEGDFDPEERVDFGSLLEAVRMVEGEPEHSKNPETLSIIEVQESTMDPGLEQTVAYKIQEDGEAETWSNDTKSAQSEKKKFEVKPPSSGKSSRRKSGRKSARSSQELTNKPSKETESATGPSNDLDVVANRDSVKLGAKLKDIQNEVKREDFRTLSSQGVAPSSKSSIHKEKSTHSKQQQNIKSEKSDLSKEKLASSRNKNSAQSRPSSVKSRPQTGSRDAQSRAGSRQGSSRPGSRTTARSRASSRLDNPGLLTKSPSEALKDVARMTPTENTYKGIDSFFMVGVNPSQHEERTLTPTQHKNKEEKIKVSNRLYSMAPRSWKPDFSLTDTVDVEEVDKDEAEDDRASSVMAYHAYSEQLVSDITERLISRFGELPIDEDSLSDQSSGGAHRSLGEEFRTFTPRSHSSSVQNSPSMSGRGTPTQMMRTQIKDSGPTPRNPLIQQTSQTPRQSARARAQTPKVSKSRAEINTPRRSVTFHGETERPLSRAIVMEGTDLSIYDSVGEKDNRDIDDEEAIDQLEYELASQSGRITADGKISRMEMPDDSEDSLNDSLESYRSASRLGHDQGYDINSRLRKDELEDDETITDDENDVRNLM